MKHIFSKIAKIGEEVREAQQVELAKGDAPTESQINGDLNKAFQAASSGYDMVMKAKSGFQKSILQYKTLISKYEKEMQAWPDRSPAQVTYKKAIEKAKAGMKEVEGLQKLADRFPTF